MKALKIVAAVCLLAVLGVAGFLGWRVADAQARTPAIVAGLVRTADPEVLALPPRRVDALLRVEDPTFWTNNGVDMKTPGAGYTTLSQGLGKLIYFEDFQPGPWDKLQLMLMARFAMTPTVSKRDILTATLSAAYLGRDGRGNVFGLAEAARRYYGRPLSRLTDDEFLSLVALFLEPSRDPLRQPARNAERTGRIKRLLAGSCRPTDVKDVALEGCRA